MTNGTDGVNGQSLDHTGLRVAYLGPEASFSHQATKEAFPEGALHVPMPNFNSIFSALQASGTEPSSPLVFSEDKKVQSSAQDRPDHITSNGTTDHFDYAVLPVENSTNGSVIGVLDLMIQCGICVENSPYPDVEVVGEQYLEVHHNLFVNHSMIQEKGATELYQALKESKTQDELEPLLEKLDVKTLYTHPQVWGQCGNFLSKYFPSVVDTERIDMSSTSASANLVAKQHLSQPPPGSDSDVVPLAAALSSRLAGDKYGLACLAENIEDVPGKNTTRFLILHNKKRAATANVHLPPLQPLLPQLSSLRNGGGGDNIFSSGIGSAGSGKSTNKTIYKYKSLVTFMIPHIKTGSLALALGAFSNHGFNLTAIQTRPSKIRNWQYVFFVECEFKSISEPGTPKEEIVHHATTEMEAIALGTPLGYHHAVSRSRSSSTAGSRRGSIEPSAFRRESAGVGPGPGPGPGAATPPTTHGSRRPSSDLKYAVDLRHQVAGMSLTNGYGHGHGSGHGSPYSNSHGGAGGYYGNGNGNTGTGTGGNTNGNTNGHGSDGGKDSDDESAKSRSTHIENLNDMLDELTLSTERTCWLGTWQDRMPVSQKLS